MSILELPLTRRALPCVALFAALAVPALVHAQEPLKPGPSQARSRPVCAPLRPPAPPNDDDRGRARELAQRGQQAAILGDVPAALRALRDASSLDPSSAELAYQLARVHETVRDTASAVREYCRYLALAPRSPETPEVVDKLWALAPPKLDQLIDLPLAIFHAGVAAFYRGDLAAADTAFSAVIASDSTWADAYYNRARVRQSVGDGFGSRADLAKYVALNREASSRPAGSNEFTGTGPRFYDPLVTLGMGAIIPGGGYFYTQRPVRGVLTMIATGGAAATGLIQRTTGPRTSRPFLVAGSVTAGVIWALTAFDAAMFARDANLHPRQVGLRIAPTTDGVAAQLSIPIP
jgi:tetratricopeptide (TPR) repeat protein